MTLSEWQNRELARLKLEAETGFSFHFEYGAITTSPTRYEDGKEIETPAAGVVTKIYKIHDASELKELVYHDMLDIPYELTDNTALVDIRAVNEAKNAAVIKALQADKEELRARAEQAEKELAEYEALI